MELLPTCVYKIDRAHWADARGETACGVWYRGFSISQPEMVELFQLSSETSPASPQGMA